MNLTYCAAVVQIVFGLVGLVFGWIDGGVALQLILTGFGVFGIRKSVGTPLGSSSTKLVHW